jgi:hypothetical protein
MYYLASGFKYFGGNAVDFSPGSVSGPQVKANDTVGLLVETYPQSKANTSGPRVSLFVNGKCFNQLFSKRSLKRGESYIRYYLQPCIAASWSALVSCVDFEISPCIPVASVVVYGSLSIR